MVIGRLRLWLVRWRQPATARGLMQRETTKGNQGNNDYNGDHEGRSNQEPNSKPIRHSGIRKMELV